MAADLLAGLSIVATPVMIAWIFGGVLLGLVVGVIPGLTATLAIALLLPLTYGMDAVEGLVVLTGIYIGGIYGGSVTAILVRIPGAPANALTMLDGYPMAKAGKPEAALGLSTFSSFVGGLIGGILLVLFAPQLARVSLQFQSPEMFSLVVLALVAVVLVTEGPLSKGLAALILGVMLSTIGLDTMLPVPRFTLGSYNLLVGIPLLPLVVGLFAVTEVFWQVGTQAPAPEKGVRIRFSRIFDFASEARRVGWKLFAKSGAIGAFLGALPGGGATMAAFVSYSEAKRSSKHPETFGTGNPEGIVAPETANNAMTGGAFVPLLAFGIPGDAVTVVILGALLIQGIVPGPQLFTESATLVAPLFVAFFVAYFILFVVGMAVVPWISLLAKVNRALLFPFIAGVSVVAGYVSERTMFGMGLTVAIGLLGYGMVRYGFPVIPTLLGLILGPMLESNLRRSLILSEGDPTIFLRSPLSALLLGIATAMLVYVGVLKRRATDAAGLLVQDGRADEPIADERRPADSPPSA